MSTPPDPGSFDQPPQGTSGQGSGTFPGSPTEPGAAGYQYGGLAGAPAGPPKEALAGFWIRFVGALIDGILLFIVAVVVAFILGEWGLAFFLIHPLGLAYFTYFHATIAGQTVGNRVVGIRIADATAGGPIPYSHAFLRFLMSYVSSWVVELGYLWMLWDDRNQTWHDKVANTLVVRTSHYPPQGDFGKPQSS